MKVDPTQLDGFASQLERNSEAFIDPLRTYLVAQCGRTGGMTGLLAAVRPAVTVARDVTAGLLSSGERNLGQVATNLRAAASSYRAGDREAAERIWRALPGRQAPEGFVDRDDDRHPGDFRDPVEPRPAPPGERHELKQYVEEAHHHIGVIDEWLQRYVHVSLSAQVFPWISGDWDTLRENADGYASLAGPDGVQALRANLAYGMDSLSARWDSEAATEFAYQIRGRWLPAIDTLEHFLTMHKEAFEWLGQQSENTLHALVMAVEVLKFWVIEKVLRIIKITGSVIGLGRVWEEVTELLTHVLSVWHMIKMLFEALRLAFASVCEALQFAGAEATVVEDMWLASGDNPIVSG